MLSPTPCSLFCAILVSLPLALIFTLASNSSTLTTTFTSTHHHLIFALLSPPTQSPPSPSLPLSPPPPSLPLSPQPPTPPPPTPSPSAPPLPKLIIKPLKNLAKNPTLYGINMTSPIKALPTYTPPQLPPPPPPPRLPEDDKDDVELLKQASKVNPNILRGPKKVAFLFLTTTPLPFAPIWEMFFNQSNRNDLYNIYIHTNPKVPMYYNSTPPFTGVFQGRVLPSSKATRRNTPTLIAAARRLLAHALLDDPNNYIFTLISASCVPLHSFNFTYATLTSSNKSFIEILNNETTAYGRWTARGIHVMLPQVPLEDFRIGSQFWSLTRPHARVVVEDINLWRKFRLPCVTLATCFPEENYFPTLLSMMDPRGVVPSTLTNVNWRGSRNGHPKTYNGSEVEPGLIQWLRDARPRYGDLGVNGSGGYENQRWDPFLFARKFAPNCVQPLLSIANDFLFKD